MSKQILSYTNHYKLNSPVEFKKGYGDIIVDSEGKSYFDATSGLWNVNYGYCNKEIQDAVVEQMEKLHFYPNHFWSYADVTEKAAEEITKLFGYSKVYFGNSGSDAIDTASYIARFCFNGRKTNLVTLTNSYHGATKLNFVNTKLDLSDVDHNTALLVIEPLKVNSGVREISWEIINHAYELKRKYGFLIAYDETVTALGRAGDLAYALRNFKPDILIASKGLTNGMFPLSATMVSEEVADQIYKTNEVFNYGYTTSGHPLACAALLKVLELYKKYPVSKTAKGFEKYLKVNTRQYGLTIGIDVKDGPEARKEAKKLNYLVRNYNNTIIVCPMFTSTASNYASLFEYLNSVSVSHY